LTVNAHRMKSFRGELPLLAIAIVAVGIALIHSASADPPSGAMHGLAAVQARWLVVALAGFAVAAAVPYREIERHTWLLYAGMLPLLLGVHVFGQLAKGAHSWYKLPGGVKFQPSEVAKIVLLCAVAKTLMYRRDAGSWRAFAAVALVAGPPLVSIVTEPELGAALTFTPAILAMLFVAGAPLSRFAALGAAGLAAFVGAFRFGVLKGFQHDRIAVYLHRFVPDALWVFGELPKKDAGFQTEHGLRAIAGGGLLGAGLGHGAQTQASLIPEAHTDFIFAVAGEEGGLVLAGLLLLLWLALLLVCLDVAQRTREPFGRYLCVGIATLFAAQIFVNVGMTLGLTPVTGITLPLVSYGGSSLLTCFIALGLVANVASRPTASLGNDFGD
jgi:rod shape determining protein RodA